MPPEVLRKLLIWMIKKTKEHIKKSVKKILFLFSITLPTFLFFFFFRIVQGGGLNGIFPFLLDVFYALVAGTPISLILFSLSKSASAGGLFGKDSILRPLFLAAAAFFMFVLFFCLFSEV